jgi:hypothetical protein
MHFPERFIVTESGRSIPNPAVLGHRFKGYTDARQFQGRVEDYDFERQATNFANLEKVLVANGTKFGLVAAAHYKGDLHTNHRFVAAAEDGSLFWYKYVAHVAQGGQNHVYVAGMRVKVSLFLGLPAHQQKALLSNSVSKIAASGLTEERLKFLNEINDLWS